MKKQLTLKNIIGLLGAFLIVFLYACKKDSSASASLTGKWANNLFASRTVIGQYEFKSNDSVEYYSYQIDTATKKIIGYNYRVTGTYTLSGNTLTINNQTAFTNPTNSFSPVSALVKNGNPATATYTFSITKPNNKATLSLYFNCPAYADCVPSPLIYYKQ